MDYLTVDLKKAKTVILIDSNNTAWRMAFIYRNIPFKRYKGDPLEFGFSKALTTALSFAEYPALLVFARDANPITRKQLFPEYKANRQKVTARAIEDPVPAFYAFSEKVPGWVLKEKEDCEADDLIASFFYQKSRNKKTLIYSTDKDLYSLLSEPNVAIVSGKELKTRADVFETYHLLYPDRLPMLKAVLGDASDGIQPIRPRLKRKQIAALVNNSPNIAVFCDLLKEELRFSDWELQQVVLRYRYLFKLHVACSLSVKINKEMKSSVFEEALNYLKPASSAKKAVVKQMSVWR